MKNKRILLSDEALYQQMLKELTPGAREYDRLLAQHRHAQRRRCWPAIARYAAACVVCVILWYMGCVALCKQYVSRVHYRHASKCDEETFPCNSSKGFFNYFRSPATTTAEGALAPAQTDSN